LGVIRW